MPRFPGFVSGSYQSQSPIADAERTMNFYEETIEAEAGANRHALYPTPGSSVFLTVADVGARALFSMAGRTFAVVGGGFYELFVTQTSTKWGAVTQDQYPATISYNGVGGQLFITSGGNGYCFVLATNTLSLVLTNEATMGAMLDGYFIAFNILNGKVRLSNLNDGTTWDPTQFFLRSTQPDPWQTMIVDGNRQLWLIGEQSGDVYYDTGALNQPFAPIPGSTFRYGTISPFSPKLAGNTLCWMGRNADGTGVIVAARGYVPTPFSNYAVDTSIANLSRTFTITDAEALVYQDYGHTFYALNLATAHQTWVADVDKQQWHERGTWNPAQNRFDVWKYRVHCYAFGKHLVGDRMTGTISALDATLGTESDGTAIVRVRRAPTVRNEHLLVDYRKLEVLLETGLGTATGQGVAPVVNMRYSDDGGRTWSNERPCGSGRMGQYRTRVYWQQLGHSRDRMFEIVMSDPIAWRLIEAWINNIEGAQAA